MVSSTLRASLLLWSATRLTQNNNLAGRSMGHRISTLRHVARTAGPSLLQRFDNNNTLISSQLNSATALKRIRRGAVGVIANRVYDLVCDDLVDIVGKSICYCVGREVQHDEQMLACISFGVCIDLFVGRGERRVGSVGLRQRVSPSVSLCQREGRVAYAAQPFLPERKHAFPETQHAVRIVFLLGDVPIAVVVVDTHPWLDLRVRGAEACVRAAIPLHGIACVIAGLALESGHDVGHVWVWFTC
jgi:hypothetical protein